jgi:GNAT superfamily N-acetyltransferase
MTDRELAEINERNIEAFSLLAGKNGEVCDEPTVKWAYTGTGAFNRVLTPRFTADEADARISELISSFGSRGVKISWVVGPSSTPDDVGTRLEGRGFRRREWACMGQESVDLPDSWEVPRGLQVVEIAEDSLFKPWSTVLCRGFGWQANDDFCEVFARLGYSKELPLRHFFGLYDGKPASACSVFEGDESRGVYLVAVDPEFRRLGLGLATTWYALNESRKLGDRLTVLQASDMGKGVYEKLGFTTHCIMGFYVPGS